jgi:hypothetical protein
VRLQRLLKMKECRGWEEEEEEEEGGGGEEF